MTITLGKNVASLAAQQRLGEATSKLASVYQQLSSGLRINNASDDAAGLAIATQLNSSARVLTQGVRNVNDAVSASTIAEGALDALKDISQRQLELAEQASNGTYSQKQRQAMNTEANALVDEYNRIVSTTTFNGLNLLDPALGTVLIQAGYGQAGTLQLGLSDQLKRAVGNGTFSAGQTIAPSFDLNAIATGDFNNDGKLDLITDGGFFALGNGDGTFQAATSISAGGSSFAVADINGDGNLDLLEAVPGSGATILLGNGNGTFKAPMSYVNGGFDTSISTGDFNGDGNVDFVTANWTAGTISIGLGNGDGTFQTNDINLGDQPISATAGDFNNDGKLDLLVGQAGQTSLLLGNGNGTFQAPISFVSAVPWNVQVGDLNGDGNLDYISTSTSGANVSVSLGNGDGTFSVTNYTTTGGTAKSVALQDLNGDGRLDIAVANDNLFTGNISILLNNGNGTFKSPTTIATSGAADELVTGDFNSDGRSDIFYGDDDSFNPPGLGILIGNGGYTSTSAYVNLSSQSTARDALNTIQNNLNRIEGQLGAIGATNSKFTVALNTLQAQSQNEITAASRITDVDIAAATSELVRTQILQQAATAVLAQANQQPALILQLLK